jgi:hypothetical protein
MSVKADADECRRARAHAQRHTSKAGLNRCRHAAEKTAGQAVVIPQDEGERPYETAQAHDRDITIPILSRNEAPGVAKTGPLAPSPAGCRAANHAEF